MMKLFDWVFFSVELSFLLVFSFVSLQSSMRLDQGQFSMRSYFLLLFWGVIVAQFNFNVNGVSLIPDVIGYALIAYGAGKLSSVSSEFSVARWLAFCSIAIWLMTFFVPANYLFFHELSTTALDCTLIWKLLTGVHEHALAHYQTEFAEKALWRRNAYVILGVAARLMGVVSSSFGFGVAGSVGVLIGIVSIVFLCLVLLTLFRSRLIGSIAKKTAQSG